MSTVSPFLLLWGTSHLCNLVACRAASAASQRGWVRSAPGPTIPSRSAEESSLAWTPSRQRHLHVRNFTKMQLNSTFSPSPTESRPVPPSQCTVSSNFGFIEEKTVQSPQPREDPATSEPPQAQRSFLRVARFEAEAWLRPMLTKSCSQKARSQGSQPPTQIWRFSEWWEDFLPC